MRLFRTVRHSLVPGEGLSRYLRYALGEIVLVVAGILIALQINNWNEERIEQAQVREYARSLVGDLEADLAMLDPVLRQIKALDADIGRLADYTRGRALADMDNLHLYVYSSNFGYRPYAWNRSALEQIKSAGAFRDMDDPELVKRISAYDALTRHLDEDFANDVWLGNVASAHANQVADSNYPSKEFHDEDLLPPLRTQEGRLDAMAAQMRRDNTGLALLARDLREIHQMTNTYLQLKRNMAARHEHEVLGLIEMGQDLIIRLKTKYEL